jgi:hypothetical protein
LFAAAAKKLGISRRTLVGDSWFVIPSEVEESLAAHVFETRDVSTSLDMTHRAEKFRVYESHFERFN